MNKNVVLTKILLAILAVGFLCAVEFFILSNRVETSNISLGYTSKILLIEFTALLLGLLFLMTIYGLGAQKAHSKSVGAICFSPLF